MKYGIISFAVMLLSLFSTSVFSGPYPEVNINIKVATLEEIDRKIEKFILKIDNSLQEIPAVESTPLPATKTDLKIKYSLREPQIKGVTDSQSRFNASLLGSLRR